MILIIGEVIEIFNTNTDVKGLQGFHVVGVASERAILLDPVKAGAVGVITDLIVSRIPQNVSGGSSIKFSDGEVAKVLNVIESKIYYVLREQVLHHLVLLVLSVICKIDLLLTVMLHNSYLNSSLKIL